MKTPPPDLDAEQIAVALWEGWGFDADRVEYAPLGFGSHHWIEESAGGARRFITVDDLRAEHLAPDVETSFRRLETAFGMAATLRDVAGMPFVVAPQRDRSGALLHRLADGYSMAVFPHLDVLPSEFGVFNSEEDRVGALRLIGQVHAATWRVPVGELRRDTLVIPGRDGLETTLREADVPWTGGVYAEPARHLLLDHVAGVRAALRRFDTLAREVTSDQSGWVISHGEPHSGNILRAVTGEQVIVDWDTVAFAPPERDLRMLISDDAPDWSGYREVTGLDAISGTAIEAYRLHWDLSEIAIYLDWCRRAHEDTDEMRLAWRELSSLLGSMAG